MGRDGRRGELLYARVSLGHRERGGANPLQAGKASARVVLPDPPAILPPAADGCDRLPAPPLYEARITIMRLLSVVLALFSLFSLLVSSVSAQSITGRAVDSTGVGVAGVNIDGFDAADGSPVCLVNDGTNANGFFTTTVDSGAGVYRFVFKPPPPPGTTLVMVELDNVVVVGTTNLGNIVLPPGVSLSGRTKDVNGFPVANVDLDVVDLGTGQEMPLQEDRTNAFGNFTLAVPTTPIEVQFKTDGLSPRLAPLALELTLSGNTSLGDLALLPGHLLEGTVQRSGGVPVSGADIDVLVSATGDKLFTPNDNTNSAGIFSAVVPDGTYTLEVCPKPANLLVAKEAPAGVVNGDTNVGVITLDNGVVLSGTIMDFLGTPVQGADVDVRDSTTDASVVLCSDNSNTSGGYSVVVPTGTFSVTFRPAGDCASGLGQHRIAGVVISGNTVLGGVLPDGTATGAVFAGDGINADTIAPIAARIGATWSAPLTIGHSHGASGTLVLKIRSSTSNGANVRSPYGGRLTEFLIAGPLIASIPGSHNGASGGIAPLLIPNNSALVGRSWAAQYIVVGGGFVDLSQAVFGIIGCP